VASSLESPSGFIQTSAAHLAEHGAGAVQARELEEDRACLLRSLARDIGLRARYFRAANGGAHEKAGFETERHAMLLTPISGQ
jgi:hypothetical protein